MSKPTTQAFTPDDRLPRWWWLGAPLTYSLLAVLLGKNLGWDLLNYHWYTPYALLNDRVGVDLAVAHQATYHNPLIDLPLYWLGTQGPAWLVGACLGAAYGGVVALLGGIAHAVLQPAPQRTWLAMLLAVAGTLGGGAFPAIGNVANDVPVVMGVFAALYLALTRQQWRERTMLQLMVLCGVLAGLSAGFKLTSMIYVLPLVLSVLLCCKGWGVRFSNVVMLGIGVMLGLLFTGGYWMWRMWQFAGNPLFPYFNHWWPSPLLNPGDYGDQTYPVPSGWMGWWYPVYFALNSRHVAEWSFHDAHVAAAYVLLPASALWWLISRRIGAAPAADHQVASNTPLVQPRQALLVGVFALASYLIWLWRFGVYRYLIPLEMMTPLLLAVAAALWPLRNQLRILLWCALLIMVQCLTRFELDRQPWDAEYVAVQAPDLPEPQHSMILMAGDAPMAYVIPAFPAQIPFLRIDGWLVWRDDQRSGLARQMRARVQAHQGPLYLLFSSLEQSRAVLAAAAYALTLTKQCQQVTSNIDRSLQLCELQRPVME